MISYLEMFLGDRFGVSRKGGTRAGRWMQPKSANNMAMFGLGHENTIVGAG